MNTFKDRENAFESKFVHDEEARFLAEARATKAVAVWAAGLLERDVEKYVDEVIEADFKEAGPEDVIAKLVADLKGRANETEIRSRLASALRAAEADISKN